MQHKHNLDLTPLCEKRNLGLTLMYNTTHAIEVENRYWAKMGHQKRVIPSLFRQQRDMGVEGAPPLTSYFHSRIL